MPQHPVSISACCNILLASPGYLVVSLSLILLTSVGYFVSSLLVAIFLGLICVRYTSFCSAFISCLILLISQLVSRVLGNSRPLLCSNNSTKENNFIIYKLGINIHCLDYSLYGKLCQIFLYRLIFLSFFFVFCVRVVMTGVCLFCWFYSLWPWLNTQWLITWWVWASWFSFLAHYYYCENTKKQRYSFGNWYCPL